MPRSKMNYSQIHAKKIQRAQLLMSKAICGASKFKYTKCTIEMLDCHKLLSTKKEETPQKNLFFIPATHQHFHPDELKFVSIEVTS
jgi:hypothetical protein